MFSKDKTVVVFPSFTLNLPNAIQTLSTNSIFFSFNFSFKYRQHYKPMRRRAIFKLFKYVSFPSLLDWVFCSADNITDSLHTNILCYLFHLAVSFYEFQEVVMTPLNTN